MPTDLDDDPPPVRERLALALGGECAFATLVALVTGVPPAIEATVAFGLAIALGLEVEARHGSRPVIEDG